MFTRANELGWALFEELTSAQMNHIDLNQSRAIDGTFGGSYNPSSAIVLGGLGLDVFAPARDTQVTPRSYVEARYRSAQFSATADDLAAGGTFTLSASHFVGTGFSVAGNGITVPEPSVYLVDTTLSLQTSSTSNPANILVGVYAGVIGNTGSSVLYGYCQGIRWSASTTASHISRCSGHILVPISNPATQKIWLRSQISTFTLTSTPIDALWQQLVVTRVAPLNA